MPQLTHPNHTPQSLTGSTQTGIVLIHGFTSGPASLLELYRQLADTGHHLRLPLLPGHATSTQDLARTPFTAWQQAVQQSIHSFPDEVESIWLLGQSMGGTLALDAACRYDADPRFAGCFLINPALSFANPFARCAGLLRYVLPATNGISNDCARPGQDEHAYQRIPTAAIYELDKLITQLRQTLRTQGPILKPVTLFRSAEDHVVPHSSVQLLHRYLGEHLRTVSLPRSYHVASMDYDLDRIVSTVREMVNC